MMALELIRTLDQFEFLAFCTECFLVIYVGRKPIERCPSCGGPV